MKKQLFPIMICALVVAMSALSFKSIQQPGGESDAMVADWERAKAYTKEYLDAANDEVIAFKPTPEMRSFGQQMLHIAEANYGIISMSTGKQSPITFGQLEKNADQYKSKEALTKAVMDSYDFAIAAVKEFDPARSGEPVKFFNRFDITRGLGIQKAFEHQTHHRGQTTVYLRLKGVVPPNEKLF